LAAVPHGLPFSCGDVIAWRALSMRRAAFPTPAPSRFDL
jgi:hypothetical protein